MITPPGHIYVRYKDPCDLEKKEINIETTARGVNAPSETYLGVNTRSLELRNLKEVVGMTHVNQASVYLHNQNYSQAVTSYEKARPYMLEDPLLNELLGYSYVLSGRIEEGKTLLKKVRTIVPESVVVRQNLVDDYLDGCVDAQGIQAIFMSVDKERESIIKKLTRLQNVLLRYPEFRSGLFQLATAWLQLNRHKEALHALVRYHNLDPNDPVVEYYLAVLYAERLDYIQAWKHFHLAEAITRSRDFQPKALKELYQELTQLCPEA